MKTDEGRSGIRWYGMAAVGGLLVAGLLAGCPSRRVEQFEARASKPPERCDNNAFVSTNPTITVTCPDAGPSIQPTDTCVQPGTNVTFSSECKDAVTVSWKGDGGALFPGEKYSCFTLEQGAKHTPKVGYVARDDDDYDLYVDYSSCPPPRQLLLKLWPEFPKAGTLDVYTTETEASPEKQ